LSNVTAIAPGLVESFVDTEQYAGTSYRASNWIHVGQTKGRGRQDRRNQYAMSKKAIYVYPLVGDFRLRLGLSVNAGLGMLGEVDGLESSSWAEFEFGGASLGGARLSRRLVQVAGAKAAVPDRAFSGVAKGDWPAVKADYRLIDHPDEAAINMASILGPHRQRTVRRMQGQQTVLCVQDGCEMVFHWGFWMRSLWPIKFAHHTTLALPGTSRLKRRKPSSGLIITAR